MLRAVQLGLSVRDLESLDEGLVMDMFVEAANDSAQYGTLASQADMDKF